MTRNEIEKRAEEYAKRLPWSSNSNQLSYMGYIDGAIEVSNAQLDELIRRLDAGYKDYVWYKHLRVEVESLKIKP